MKTNEIASDQASDLFIDTGGNLVEVLWTSTDEIVEFAPQGGGAIRKCNRTDFERCFKPATPAAYAVAQISAEWLPRGMRVPAYSNGMRWNGWAMPFFTKEAGLSLLQFMPGLSFDSNRDAFVSKDADMSDEEEVFSAVTLVIEGLPIKTYDIGAGSWCWEFAE
jgi:hypothetical protein